MDTKETENSKTSNQETGLAIIPKLAQLNHVNFGKQIIENIKEGTVDPLQIHLFLKRFEELKKLVGEDKEVKEIINKEASKHIQDGKTFEYLGAKITLAAVSTKYEFNNCNDILWTNLNNLFEQIKEMKEEREKFLKAAFPEKVNKFGFTSPTVVIEHTYVLQRMDCGEEVKLNAPVKRQVDGLRVSFPKI